MWARTERRAAGITKRSVCGPWTHVGREKKKSEVLCCRAPACTPCPCPISNHAWAQTRLFCSLCLGPRPSFPTIHGLHGPRLATAHAHARVNRPTCSKPVLRAHVSHDQSAGSPPWPRCHHRRLPQPNLPGQSILPSTLFAPIWPEGRAPYASLHGFLFSCFPVFLFAVLRHMHAAPLWRPAPPVAGRACTRRLLGCGSRQIAVVPQ